MQISLYVNLCFQLRVNFKFYSLPTYQNISKVYEWDKKRLQKVFTLHYWRFFFFKFKYLFFVILFYYDMFIISSSGDWNVRKVTGQGVENQDPVIYVRRLYMNWHVHIQPRTLFLLKRCLLNQLFLRTLPLALSNPSWFRSVFCFSSSCIQKKKRGKENTTETEAAKRECQFPHTRQVD